MSKLSVIMICRANICRSPMAEAMLRHLVKSRGLHRKIQVDSAGTRASQPGHKPDVRATRVMAEAGISMAKIKARQITVKDLQKNDYVLVMDNSNYKDLIEFCPEELQHKIRFISSFSRQGIELELPDPYYGSLAGFKEVFRQLESALNDLLEELVDFAT